MSMVEVEILVTLSAAAITLALFSYLWRENLAFRIAEHAYIGSAVGYGALITAEGAKRVLMPKLEKGEYIWLLTVLVGLLYLGFFARKWFFLYRYPISIVMASGMGVYIARGVKTNLIGHALNTIMIKDWQTALLAVGVICGLFYFYSTAEHKGPMVYMSKVGRWFLMAAFGAQMGLHVMARTSLVIGRIRFLLFEYPAYYLIPVAFILVAAGIVWDYMKKK